MRSAQCASCASMHRSGSSIRTASACSVSPLAAISSRCSARTRPTPFIRRSTMSDKLSARPDFTLLIYPGYLDQEENPLALRPEVKPVALTPPSFLIQAEDDPVKVENAWVYYEALKQANIPAEMHLFANGGHGYGLRPTKLPVTHWPDLAATWLHTLGITTP